MKFHQNCIKLCVIVLRKLISFVPWYCFLVVFYPKLRSTSVAPIIHVNNIGSFGWLFCFPMQFPSQNRLSIVSGWKKSDMLSIQDTKGNNLVIIIHSYAFTSNFESCGSYFFGQTFSGTASTTGMCWLW